MSEIVQFPVVARPRPRAAVIPIREPSETPDREKQENLALVRRDLEHAVRKLLVVSEYHGELAWAARLMDAGTATIRDRIGATGAKDDNG